MKKTRFDSLYGGMSISNIRPASLCAGRAIFQKTTSRETLRDQIYHVFCNSIAQIAVSFVISFKKFLPVQKQLNIKPTVLYCSRDAVPKPISIAEKILEHMRDLSQFFQDERTEVYVHFQVYNQDLCPDLYQEHQI